LSAEALAKADFAPLDFLGNPGLFCLKKLDCKPQDMVWKMFLLWRCPFLSPYFCEKSPAKRDRIKPAFGWVSSFEAKCERTKIIEEYEL